MNDVLGGRGAPVIDNEGNHRFRKIVATRRAEYFGQSRRQGKDQIARQIVSTVRSRRGRFLKKIDDAEQARSLGITDEESNAWIELDEDTILTKVKQALRDKSTEDEEPRPRRRKRVSNGNLVPNEDDMESEQLLDQNLESSDNAARQPPGPTDIRGLSLQRSPSVSVAASADGTPLIRLPVQGESKVDGPLGGGTGQEHFLAILQQMGQRPAASPGVATAAGGGGPIYLLPEHPSYISQLPTASFIGGPSGLPVMLAATVPQYPGSTGSTSNMQYFPPLQQPPQPQHHNFQFDPRLGTASGMSSQQQQAYETNEARLRAILGSDAFCQQQQSPQPPPQQQQYIGQDPSKPCEDIILEGMLHRRAPAAPQTNQIIIVSLFEASLLLVLCDFGLPLASASPLAGSAAAAAAATSPSLLSSTSDALILSSWTWASMGETIVNWSVRRTQGRTAFAALATLCGADAGRVQSTCTLATALSASPVELGRSAIMFLEKMGKKSNSIPKEESIALLRKQEAMPLSPIEGVFTSASANRDSSKSRVQTSLFVSLFPFVSLLLEQWASRLDIVTEAGQPIAFSSEDMRMVDHVVVTNESSLASHSHQAFASAGSYTVSDCRRILSIIAALSRLRHILYHHETASILRVLTSFPDRSTPLNPSTMWWVADADNATPLRDLWLIKNALQKGVSAVVDADATSVGAPSSPIGTLRQSSVTTRQVEGRLEKLSNFLHPHFEFQSSARVMEERRRALRALLR